jgi:transposase
MRPSCRQLVNTHVSIPDVARACVTALGAQLRMPKARKLEFDRLIMSWHRSNEASKRLDEIPGVGPALATALVASVADPIWAEFFRLDWACAEATLERGQGQAGQYQQIGRSLSAQPVHSCRARLFHFRGGRPRRKGRESSPRHDVTRDVRAADCGQAHARALPRSSLPILARP